MSSSASRLILLQVSSRLVTFILTQSLVRLSSPAVFGLANIHLDLLLSTLLFLSREGVRGALLRRSATWRHRRDDDDDDDKDPSHSSPSHSLNLLQRSAQNVALIPLPIGIILSLLSSHLYIAYLAPSSLASHSHFSLSVHLYILGAILEILSEPLYTRAQSLGNVSLRIRAEGASVLLKCLSTLATIVVGSRTGKDLGLVAFGVGQAAYGATTLIVFASHFFRAKGLKHTVALVTPSRRPLPSAADEDLKAASRVDQTQELAPWLDSQALRLSLTLSKQSLVKHFLTEADKLAVAKLAALDDQGAYALASNYGSLLARLLLQPLEESLRLSVSRRLNVHPVPRSDLEASSRHLQGVLSLYATLFGFVVVFCPPLVLPLLLVVAGPRWALQTSAPRLLAVYGSLLLPCMSLNGVLEGFLQSTADEATLGRYDAVLVAASAVFGASLWVATRVGLASDGAELVWANSANLLVRAAWGWSYMRRFYHDAASVQAGQEKSGKVESKAAVRDKAASTGSQLPFELGQVLPSLPTTAIFVLCSALLNASAAYRVDEAAALSTLAEGKLSFGRAATLRLLLSPPLRDHIAISLACLGACVFACLLFERQRLRAALRVLRS